MAQDIKGRVDGDDICYAKWEQLELITRLAVCDANKRVLANCMSEKREYPVRQVIWGGVIGALIGGVAVGFLK